MSQIYCSNCGQLIPNNSNFCKFCGVAQHGQDANLYHAQQDPVAPGQLPEKPIEPLNDSIPKSHLHPTVILIFILNYLKISTILFPLLIGGIYFYPALFSLITVLAFVIIIFIALWAYSNFTYEVTKDGLLIEFGIVYKKTVSVPFSQVQNVNIERSLVDRTLNLARISIETAGSAIIQPIEVIGGYTARSEAYVPGLSLLKAKILHDILIDGKIDGNY